MKRSILLIIFPDRTDLVRLRPGDPRQRRGAPIHFQPADVSGFANFR
jgi:hypothetical protein